ncbi:TIR domain-containing protein [Paludisphaera borealis]|uniref:TIR domain-containing protein n=1 Tax=Paludisphaera borealis TaxID=1387353 RepID=UPI001F2C4EB6|nr:nucleotide-binding protein [Paludisphaera borealis]
MLVVTCHSTTASGRRFTGFLQSNIGTIEDLQTIVKVCGFSIVETREQENCKQIRTSDGAIVNWYPSTGTLTPQGKADIKKRFIDAWDSYHGTPSSMQSSAEEVPLPVHPSNPMNASKKVFVVHGHDSVAREQLELIIHKLGLNPFVLANSGGGGLTIIEALEKEIGPSNNQARFGIVLMTPDDIGYSKVDGVEKAEPRARQNVVLELGMLISAIGRPNIAILRKGHLEEPSDAKGVLYIPFNDHVKEVVPKLTNRLREAGFILNPDAIANASA